jgi:hypothetical protein
MVQVAISNAPFQEHLWIKPPGDECIGEGFYTDVYFSLSTLCTVIIHPLWLAVNTLEIVLRK